MDPAEVKKMKVPELRKELEQRGLDSTGLKPVLLERLEAALGTSNGTAAGVASHTSPVPAAASLPSPTRPYTVTAAAEEQQDKPVAAAASFTRIQFKPNTNGETVDLPDLQSKQARAKRFGIDVSEGDKQRARAERFGTASSVSHPQSAKAASKGVTADDVKSLQQHKSGILTPPTDIVSKAEELEARKARAKRFDLPFTSSEEEVAKKKARADRFGTGTAGQPTTGRAAVAEAESGSAARAGLSDAEAAKRKARAMRFAMALAPDKAATSGTTAEQAKKLEDRKIRFGTGELEVSVSRTAQDATAGAQD